MKDDQRVALTKRLLQEGLLRLLQTKDIGKINVTELCAEAGINRATFYRHYQQPRDIIGEIRLNMFYDIKRISERDEKSGKGLKSWLEDMCQYCYEHSNLLSILFRCRTDEEFVALINELYQKQFQDFRRMGYCRGMDEDELKLSAYCFAGGVFYILRQWIMEPIRKTPKEVACVIFRQLQSAGESSDEKGAATDCGASGLVSGKREMSYK